MIAHSGSALFYFGVTPNFVSHSPIASNEMVTLEPKRNLMNRLGIALSGLRQEATTAIFPSRRWILLLVITCLVAMGVSGYLGWVSLTSSKVAGCGGGQVFNCGHVISSRWSLWMGVPVSLLAVGLYAGMGVALFVGGSSQFGASIRYAGWITVTLFALAAGMAAIWFVLLQLFVIQHFCSYCLVAHGCGLIMASVVFWKQTVGARSMKLISSFSVVGIGFLICGQLIAKPPATYSIETFEMPTAEPETFEFSAPATSTGQETDAPLFEAPITNDQDHTGTTPIHRRPPIEPGMSFVAMLRPDLLFATQVAQGGSPQDDNSLKSDQQKNSESTSATAGTKDKAKRRLVSMNGGSVRLDIAQWPLVGSLNAKYVFVEMFDYSCSHCRKTHWAIKGAAEKLGGDLAVVVLPVPLNASCNNSVKVTSSQSIESCEIAELAVSVWRIDATKFAAFHNWMFAGDKAPTFAKAKAHAETLINAEKLVAELSSKVPSQYIAKNVELYKRAGSGNVPKLIFPRTTIVGEFTSINALVDVILRETK